MIRIAGAVQRSFTFPADLPATRAYFSDFRRVLAHLPHIRLVKAHGPEQFRVLYHTRELGLYDVRIYCDLEARFDEARPILRVIPLDGLPSVKSKFTLTSLTAHGYYRSESVLRPAGDVTQVEYHLELSARLPKPLGLSILSDRSAERLARSITQWRIREIADGFIELSIRDFKRRGRRRR